MKPTVTIGMCVRNCQNMLPNALESIDIQDFPHEKMQLVIIDDGSTDQTPKIAEGFVSKTDIPIKVFKTGWQGLGKARNLVLNNADGKYITWVDSDEIITKSYIRKQVEFMEKNPEVGITTGFTGFVPGNLVLNLELTPYMVKHFMFNEPRSYLWRARKLVGTGGATFRVEALRQVNGFSDKFKGAGEDIDAVIRILNSGWVIQVNDAVFYEFHNGLSTLGDLWKKYYWYGYHCEQLYHRSRDAYSLARMNPPAGFIAGSLYSLKAYRLFGDKSLFLLPFHFCFKMTSWMFGFMKAQTKN